VRQVITTAVVVAGMAAVFALGGCGGERDRAGMSVDLERDLELATAAARPRTAVVSAIEGGPTGAPSGNQRGRRDAVPTARRTARPTPIAPVTETVSMESMADAPAPVVLTPAAVEPTPAPVPEPTVQAPPDLSTEASSTPGVVDRGHDDEADRDRGAGHDGRGEGTRRGGGWGGIIGVVIRGGAAGVDHCEEHDRRRAGGRSGGRIGTRVGGVGGVIGTVIGEAIDRGRVPVGTPQRWPRY
jgi:hypothetical protein